jgi:ABC-2 type transport system ATP-binding protein
MSPGERSCLRVSAVSKAFLGRPVLDSIELGCAPGQVCAILGANGSGKSTLLRIVSGMIEPDRGSVSILGEPLARGGIAARRHLGYVPDGLASLPDLLVQEFMALVRSLKQPVSNPVAEQQWLGWRDRLGLDPIWRQRLGTLSFGQRKRACTLAALIGDPWLLLFDEPSNGLDPSGSELMVELIRQRKAAGQATVFTTNDRPFAERLEARQFRLDAGMLTALD